MKNILLIINPENLVESDIEFGCYLAKLSQSRLTGVFLENLPLVQIPTRKTVLGMPYVETMVATDLPDYEKKRIQIEDSISIFRNICSNKKVDSYIHVDKAMAVKEIINDSRFADFMIVNANTSFDGKSENVPTSFVVEVLSKSECPVVIAPDNFSEIDQILFTYDDNASSVSAIKKFTYLFPELEDKKIIIVHVGEKPVESQKQKLLQFVRMHYSNMDFQVLEGKPGEELFKFITVQTKTIVIMGSYGRNKISSFLFPSTAQSLIKNLGLPFFITHS